MGKIYLLLFPYLILTTSCNKDKFIKDETLPITYATYIQVYDIQDAQFVDSAVMFLYASETDYLIQKNEILKDTALKVQFKINIEPSVKKDYWFRIFKGNWTNERSKTYTSKGYAYQKSCGNCGTNEYSRSVHISLSTTPVRLQLKVYDNGIPVKGALVSIYLSELDYLNSKRANDFPFVQDNLSYGHYNGKITNGFSCDLIEKITNSQGQVLFENYEPRQYWFSVTKGDKSNSTTLFKTNGPLPDDSNITTVLDIGLK